MSLREVDKLSYINAIKKFAHAIYVHRILWAWLWLMSIFSIYDVISSQVYQLPIWEQIIYLIAFGAFKSTLLTWIYCWAKSKKIGWVMIIMIILYSSLCICNLYSLTYYGFGFSRKLIIVLLETNKREVSQFIPTIWYNLQSSFSTIFVIIGVAIFLIGVLSLLPYRIYVRGVLTLSVFGLILFIWFCATKPNGRTAHSFLFRGVKYTVEAIKSRNEYIELKNSALPFPNPETVVSEHLASNVVLIIGESASKEHLSLYGYPLKTTPWSDAMIDSLIVFNDAVASASSTFRNMERILTFKNDDQTYGDGLQYPSIIDLFNYAGYKTIWLSNQERVGEWADCSGVVSSKAAVVKYIGKEYDGDEMLLQYDEELLPYFYNAVKDTCENKLIVMHLMGSHTKYDLRYPADRRMISSEDVLLTMKEKHPWLEQRSAKIVAQYDNSIRYTDSIVSQVVNIVSSLSTSSILVYLSDHGENVFDYGNCISRGARSDRVPFVIYANSQFRDHNPMLYAKILKARDLPISTANVIYPIMTLTGTTYSWYDGSRDFLSPNFINRHRFVDEELWPYEY